jgi:hypothetical protein
MTDRARIAINISERSVEIEGPQTFVESYAERIEQLLDKLVSSSSGSRRTEADSEIVDRVSSSPTHVDLGEFGAYVQRLSKNVTDVDRMLAAGFWVQAHANDDCFGTGESSKLLLDHGHKIGNPSQCVKQSINARNIFMTTKGRYRVSREGRDRLRLLMGDVIPH